MQRVARAMSSPGVAGRRSPARPYQAAYPPVMNVTGSRSRAPMPGRPAPGRPRSTSRSAAACARPARSSRGPAARRRETTPLAWAKPSTLSSRRQTHAMSRASRPAGYSRRTSASVYNSSGECTCSCIRSTFACRRRPRHRGIGPPPRHRERLLHRRQERREPPLPVQRVQPPQDGGLVGHQVVAARVAGDLEHALDLPLAPPGAFDRGNGSGRCCTPTPPRSGPAPGTRARATFRSIGEVSAAASTTSTKPQRGQNRTAGPAAPV